MTLYALSVAFLLLSRAYKEEASWLYYGCLGLGILFFVLGIIRYFNRDNTKAP